MGPLHGIRVLDLSRVLAGPWCGQILGDLGAEVIKIERPGAGDDTRSWGPPFLRDGDGAATGVATYFLAANRNKQSLAVDLTRPEGQAIIHQLAERSDILLENFKCGDLARYGLDPATMLARYPRLVYCSITGFGQTGPNAHRPGYDFIIQAMAGLMSITGTPQSGPQKAGVAVTDLTTGMMSAIGCLAALHHARTTGQGQHIDMALFDVQLGWLANQNMSYLGAGKVPGLLGNAHPSIVPYQDFPTADRPLIIAVGNDRQFADLARLLGEAGWSADPRFATNSARVAHRDVLVPMIAGITIGQPSAHWQALLDAAAIPCGPIQTIAEAFGSEQVRARDLAVTLPHPVAGTVTTVANPIRMEKTPADYRLPPPMLGEHSDAILRALGHSDAEIAALRAAGIIG